MLVRLEPAAPWSQVKHSATVQLRSQHFDDPDLDPNCLQFGGFLKKLILKKAIQAWKITQHALFGFLPHNVSFALKAPIATKVVCFSRLLKCLRTVWIQIRLLL